MAGAHTAGVGGGLFPSAGRWRERKLPTQAVVVNLHLNFKRISEIDISAQQWVERTWLLVLGMSCTAPNPQFPHLYITAFVYTCGDWYRV